MSNFNGLRDSNICDDNKDIMFIDNTRLFICVILRVKLKYLNIANVFSRNFFLIV